MGTQQVCIATRTRTKHQKTLICARAYSIIVRVAHLHVPAVSAHEPGAK